MCDFTKISILKINHKNKSFNSFISNINIGYEQGKDVGCESFRSENVGVR